MKPRTTTRLNPNVRRAVNTAAKGITIRGNSTLRTTDSRLTSEVTARPLASLKNVYSMMLNSRITA
jgi:hypothetical protein